MDPKHITSRSLRHLLTLTEKKEQLLKGLEAIETEIAKALTGAEAGVAKTAKSIKPAKSKKSRKAKAGKSGGLKARILALLHDAGDQGLKVKEIAEKLEVKAANISVWFSTTGKKLATKLAPGRYMVRGAKPVASPVQPVTGYLKPPASLEADIKKAVRKPARSKKKKNGITPEGRARLAANMKARWAGRKAGKPAGKIGKPAKKGFKLPKAGKNPF